MENYILSFTKDEVECLRTEIVVGGHLRGNERVHMLSILGKLQKACPLVLTKLDACPSDLKAERINQLIDLVTALRRS